MRCCWFGEACDAVSGRALRVALASLSSPLCALCVVYAEQVFGVHPLRVYRDARGFVGDALRLVRERESPVLGSAVLREALSLSREARGRRDFGGAGRRSVPSEVL